MKFIECDRPGITSFTLIGGGLVEFKSKLNESKKLVVDVRKEGKTRLDVAVQSGEIRYGVNFRSKWAKENNIKFDEKDEFNYFHGESNHLEYFKLKKNQGKTELIKHIESLVKDNIVPRFGVPDEVVEEMTVYIQLPTELRG